MSKRILFLTDSPSIGGSEKQMFYLAEYFQNRCNFHVKVFNISNADKHFLSEISRLKLRYKEILYPASKNNFRQILKYYLFKLIIFLTDSDIILSYQIIPNVFSANLFWSRKQVCIWNQRDEGIINFEYNKKYLNAAIMRATCFIANSNGGSTYLKKSGAAVGKIYIIKNGFDWRNTVNEIALIKLTGDDIANNTFSACMVANIHANKDFKTLIDAWRIVVDNLYTVKPVLYLIGKEYDYSKIVKEQINKLNLNNFVVFTGFISDVSKLLNNCDIYVHSSISEGMSNSLIEAMYAGKAIVATAINSVKETVSEANMAFLSPPRDARDFALKIIQFANNRDLRQSIGNANLAFAKIHYRKERMCKEYIKVLGNYVKNIRCE